MLIPYIKDEPSKRWVLETCSYEWQCEDCPQYTGSTLNICNMNRIKLAPKPPPLTGLCTTILRTVRKLVPYKYIQSIDELIAWIT